MDRLYRRKHLYVIFIAVSVVIISYLHYSTLPNISDLHNILAELYYIPLLLGALVFGLRGAIITFLFVALLYIPHVVINWSNSFVFIMNKFLHGVTSGVFALLAGYLIDREKRLRDRHEKDRYLAGLGQAAAAIVHDLKNPLITITGFAKRIRNGKGNARNASEAILDAAGDMQLIVGDVLDFARPVKLSMTEADAGEVVAGVCRSVETSAGEKGVTVAFQTSGGPDRIPMDTFHIGRAMVNLLNNAIEASYSGSTVDVYSEIRDDSFIIKIRDSGQGMDRETLENVFVPFYTRKSAGTGLGMAIAKKIIEGHHGDISVESRQGTGTEVTVKLPRRPVRDIPSSSTCPSASGPGKS